MTVRAASSDLFVFSRFSFATSVLTFTTLPAMTPSIPPWANCRRGFTLFTEVTSDSKFTFLPMSRSTFGLINLAIAV